MKFLTTFLILYLFSNISGTQTFTVTNFDEGFCFSTSGSINIYIYGQLSEEPNYLDKFNLEFTTSKNTTIKVECEINTLLKTSLMCM